MYSKNDYRYYLEARLTHSDNYLAHYGVKGMKWKKHQRSKPIDPDYRLLNREWYNTQIDQERGKQRTSDEAQRYIRQDQNRGLRRTAKEHIKTDQAHGKKRTEQFKGKSSEYLREVESNSKKNNFPKANTKKKKKSNRKPFTIESLRRVKPKGKNLKGSNIYVTHN